MFNQPKQNGDKQQANAEQSKPSAPTISLPKGGGAIRGMGEKFAANPVTGTGSMSVPIATSPGRSNFSPQLSLSYDSGSGNGPFGFGWGLSVPAITRKTDKGLPKYHDAEESDVFILSGAEDLVPVLQANDQRFEDNTTVPGFTIHRYRPRIEGLFARIERWTRKSDGDVHWRSISKDNLTTLYGKTAESRIVDPDDSTRIFSWLICESYDDKGNAIFYKYKEENTDSVGLSFAHEKNRTPSNRSANRYLKRIKYGNQTPRQPSEDLSLREDWLFEAVFDYGEHDSTNPKPSDVGEWLCRHDPFSSYRAGFEARTYRLCQRVLMFHHFSAEEGVGQDCLVRSTDFVYRNLRNNPDDLTKGHPIASFIATVTQSGYKRQGNGYLKKSLPPLEFEYSQAIINEEVKEIDAASLENLPYGLDGARYQWMDLDNEGIQGILTEQAEAWFYKRNLSPISFETTNGRQTPVARFAPIELVATKPSLADLNGGRQQFMDLAGDGQVDLVQFAGSVPGYYERTDEGEWEAFVPFASHPQVAWNDPNLKFVDLTGDGHADILISEDEVFTWFPSLAEAGFDAAEKVRKFSDEEKGPALVFADGTQSIYLADISGDGLTDLVRIRNGEVCYWPNLGYGRFGAKVTMDRAPWFDRPDQFDQRRIHLADIDGSGVTDIIYLGRNEIRLYFNESGNSWSEARTLKYFPRTDNLSTVTVVDLLGNGTACLVWSSPLPNDARQPMRYIDLMGGQKPHLLISTKNNLGAETKVTYASSTKFYLQDKLEGRPWITKLPFPVHVVERVTTYDRISRNRFVTRHAYHHGYFDGVEREFRGFGMVEQFDTEEFAALNADQQLSPATNLDSSSHVPPMLTRTWFHTGVYLGRDRISNFFAGLLDENDAGEYYREPGLNDEQARQLLLDDTVLPPGLTFDEEREACRALKGAMLRQEVYALDGTDQQSHPYTVTEQNFTIRLLQPQGENPHAVFFSHPRESIGYHYERIPADPRVAHSVTLEVDDFGNVLKSAAVAYGRRRADPALEARDQLQQGELHLTYAENRVTNAVDTGDDYRAPLPVESRSYELTGLALLAGRNRFTLDELLNAGPGGAAIAYEQSPTSGVLQKRLIEHVRTLYRRNDLAGALPLGQLESLALPFESYKLAFTPGLLAGVYGTTVTDSMLANEGRYVHSEGDNQWWIPAGRIFHSPGANDDAAAELANARQHFFLPRRYQDPFGQTAFVSFDAYDLLMTETRDALANVVTVGERDASGNLVTPGNDYRVLQPRLVTDPNGNRAAVSIDAMGMVVGTAIMGKRGETPRRGDLLDGFVPDLADDVVTAHLTNPLADPHAILARATTRLIYDLFAYYRTRQQPQPAPNVVYALVRETHDADLAAGGQTKVQHSFSYSDGFGREIQKKIQAEPGPIIDGGPVTNPRWVGSGWTVFNNKGKPVRQFEPFFTDTHRFEFDVRIGVSPVLFYDPAERVVATLHPNHTWEKVVFDPWRQETWDVNDTALIADPKSDPEVGDFFQRLAESEYLPTWYAQRQAGALGPEEQDAAAKTAIHAATPSVAHADSLGRTFLTIAHNRFKRSGADPPTEEFHATRVVFDIEGNQREVIDAKDRVAMRYDYDMLGSQIHQASMEAGERWMLNDVAGKPIYSWDSRDHQFRTAYDPLQRPNDAFLREGAGPERRIGRTVYGESRPNPEAKNLRGKAVQLFDQAGVVTTEEYDFKGNPLASQRQLAREYKATLDWFANVPLESEVYTSSTRFDALNRPTSVTAPDNSVYRPTFNEANLLEKVDVNLRGAAVATPFVADIDYDAKGQRELIEYGNGVITTYEYDPLTFRLTNLKTLRGTDTRLQDLFYTYDPVGNITHIRDEAQQTIYFNGQVVEPHCDYVYDALYRLIDAKGREHIGQATQPQTTSDDRFRVNLPHPNDGQAMRRYTERYEYDAAGNFLQLIHQATNGNWTRSYAYIEPSLIEPGKTSNRLSRTTVGSNTPVTEPYAHDAHGNMTAMPHLTLMQWDFKDQLSATSRQVVNNGTPETTYYVYDGAGQRVRKVTELVMGQVKDERIYLGGFEIYRRQGVNPLVRETLHIMDDKQRIALVETRTQGTDGSPARLIRYQFANHLGSASLELDDQAQIISYEEYTPYGSASYQAVRSGVEVSSKRYRYTGMERDEETGFTYHGARYFAAWLGRWGSADPLGVRDDLNSYAYVHARPLTLSDSSGTEGEDPLPPAERWDDAGFDFRESIPPTVPFQSVVAKPEPECVKGKLGPKGEFFRAPGERRAPPTKYTKPYAIDAAAKGKYEFAELAEHYMCPTCHIIAQVGHTPSDYEFSVEPYVRDYQRNYQTLAGILISTFTFGGLAIAYPTIAAGVGAFGTGVATGEAITGRSSGALNPGRLLSGDFEIGRELSTGERVLSGVEAVIGLFGIRATTLAALSARSEVTNGFTNLGQGFSAGNASTLSEFGPGSGFSGVYNPTTRQFLAHPSGDTRLLTGGTPQNLVPRRGGHGAVNAQFSQMTGVQPTSNVGFTMFLEQNDSISIQWLSGSVNGRFPGNLVPEALRPQIIHDIATATGRTVR